ncbi:putative copper resistance protein D [Chryseomicrobium aureum]|uniref:copper resistance D family protein n=1 Tax=Chryseomicrobium aureum TaxID=1441723 RepID=UPI00195BA068|nr:CopD family protein [Chryseomicrobium aureum]MBM7707177.1 putative copper resistance protein D [Chryseomicrobium aureum]
MELLVMAGQLVLSLGLAVLVGSFLLLAVPVTKRPALRVSPIVILISTLAVVIGAFIPILQITFALMPRLSFTEAFEMVVLSYRTGLAWDFTLLGGVLLIVLYALFQHRNEWFFQAAYLALTVFMIGTIAWASHASSIAPVRGFVGDFLHLLAAAIWVGVVLVIAWFATTTTNWLNWLKWFSPVAFICFITMGVSGFLLMDLTVPNYVTGLSTSYGQGLFIKQLLMIPLIAYIVINSFFMKRWLITRKLNPIPWVRAESVILFAIFMVTAFFSHQAPPSSMVTEGNLSALSLLFLEGSLITGEALSFELGLPVLFFGGLAFIFGGLVVTAFIKRAPIAAGGLFGVASVACAYIGMMSGIIVS